MMSQNLLPKVWFITGAARGLGLEIAKQVIAQGDRLSATSRDLNSLHQALGEDNPNILPLEVDLTSQASIQSAVLRTVAKFKKIDYVVNNAGYALQGTVEALSDDEIRRNFDINVFAVMSVLRASLAQLRHQRSGHIFNICSIVGFQGGYAGWSSYAGSKFALAGITEALNNEVRELGIHATIVYPGPIRTEFLSDHSLCVAKQALSDYTEAQKSLELHRNELHGAQIGAPVKIAQLIIQAAQSDNPPLHLFAGSVANELAAQKIDTVKQDLENWKDRSEATDFD